jgi:hypothetical protein
MRHSIRVASLLILAPVFAAYAFAADVRSAAVKVASAQPAPVAMYQVRGLKWNGRQYIDQPGYLLNTPNRKQAQDYAAQFARFPGWCVVTNLPGNVTSPSNATAMAAAVAGTPNANVPPYILNWLYRLGIDPSQLRSVDPSDPIYGANSVSTYSDTSDIQNMIATQDMLNRQQEFNNLQDMINTQNFINTQNMINNMQNDVNTQNMVNEQNMINAMNNP